MFVYRCKVAKNEKKMLWHLSKNKIAHKFFVDELYIYVLAKALTFPTKKVGLKPDSIDIFRIMNYSLIETFVPCVWAFICGA